MAQLMSEKIEPATDEQIAEWGHGTARVSDIWGSAGAAINALIARVEQEQAKAEAGELMAETCNSLDAKNAKLREALVRYADHDLDCPARLDGKCTCGLLAALGGADDE